jgi:hypothetical protein
LRERRVASPSVPLLLISRGFANRLRFGGNMIGPYDEGAATGRGQAVKPAFDPLEPTIDIALQDFGCVGSK